ncbi:MAG TPA: FAD-dependent 5-carboxymethylaminomethyl-2-thiouridine(34) oxidoreductase MnmC, partial [Burkholderiaceae bacterium]|nr:FAD-dependent 5-carboxymethylaminomethyl-2-thiouridine(34) oxidoreductase MnmC [Burkholderiaceae bacterium]
LQMPVPSDNDGLQELRTQLALQWPTLVAGLHRMEFEAGRVVLTLALGDALELMSQLQLGVDALYLDGFAPDRNPRMWDLRLFRALARLARPDSTAATYSCARAVREALADNGFIVQRRPGWAGKREMVSARFAPRWKMRRHEPRAAYDGEPHAIVVGAGLAGCCTAYALRRRGWRVTLIERGHGPASEASGLPTGLLRPLLSADDNHTSQLTRAGFLFGLRLLQRLAPHAVGEPVERLWSACGVFEQSQSVDEALAAKAMVQQQAWPADFAEFCDTSQAAAHLGLAPRYGGTWFARGAVVAAARWCRALLDDPGPPTGAAPLTQVYDFDVSALAHTDRGWSACDRQGRCHQAPILVLANAIGLTKLPQFDYLPLHEVAGRISLLASPALTDLRAAMSGDGYLLPPILGGAAIGASYEAVSTNMMKCEAPAQSQADEPGAAPGDASAAAHRENLQRLSQMLADPPAMPVIQGVFVGRRCVSKDRLPVAGTLPDPLAILRDRDHYRGAHLPDLPRLDRLYCLSALGSRGLVLAPLLGEHLASMITGEPAPIETALAAAVDPARFLLRQLR